jgi:hypothetical protein
MKRFLVLALVGLVVAPIAAAGQDDPAARIDAARQRAAAAGIPLSLLDSRVAEGRAKGIPDAQIAAVVERRAVALTQARDAMAAASGLNAADLSAGADAIEAGIGGQTLRSLIAGARSEDRPVAIAVLTYLHQEQGMPVGEAMAQVRAAMGEGPEALRTLPGRAAAARDRRGPPAGVGRPDGVGRPPGTGPPAGVPGPGQKPGSGKPDNPGRGNSGGNRPGGKGGG